jgi:hypothetical protein
MVSRVDRALPEPICRRRVAEGVGVVATGSGSAEVVLRRVRLVSVTPPPIHNLLSIRAQFVMWLVAGDAVSVAPDPTAKIYSTNS